MQAAPLQEIGTVDAECTYAHSDLTRAGFGYGDVSYLEDLWSARLVYDDSSHASMHLRSPTQHRNCRAPFPCRAGASPEGSRYGGRAVGR